MKVIEKSISKKELQKMANVRFKLVKAVVDIEKQVMALDAELHADEEAILLSQGSLQEHLWGINLYPQLTEDWIEFDSMINIRPWQGNLSRNVEDKKIQKKITAIVRKLISS